MSDTLNKSFMEGNSYYDSILQITITTLKIVMCALSNPIRATFTKLQLEYKALTTSPVI